MMNMGSLSTFLILELLVFISYNLQPYSSLSVCVNSYLIYDIQI